MMAARTSSISSSVAAAKLAALIEAVILHPGVFARFIECHRAVAAAYRAAEGLCPLLGSRHGRPLPRRPHSFDALRKVFGPLWVRCDVCRRYARLHLGELRDVDYRVAGGGESTFCLASERAT
jgi:hypothetical protein